MGPNFPLSRATWVRGYMVPDPPTAGAGDCSNYAPNDPRRKERPTCVVGRPGCMDECSTYDGSENDDEEG